MSTFAIGDIQGCFSSFCHLLDRCRFNPEQDRLWLVGDLVNRGPQSLQTLRFVRQLGDAVTLVLGNHDLYLLMVACGGVPRRQSDDTLQAILSAPDCDDLLDWLRHQPLCHVENGYCLVHAGLLPQWSAAEAKQRSIEVEQALQGPHFESVLRNLWGSEPSQWSPALSGIERLRMIVNVMTRMRFCNADKSLNFKAKGLPENAPPELLPWFDLPNPLWANHTLIVGHWSASGLRMTPSLLCIDTGCLWGGQMTAIRLEDRALFQVDCALEDRVQPTF